MSSWPYSVWRGSPYESVMIELVVWTQRVLPETIIRDHKWASALNSLITIYLTSQGRSFGLNSWSMSSTMTSNTWLVTLGRIGCYYDLWRCAELLIAIKISARRNFDSLWITSIYEALQSFGLGWGQAIKSGWRQSISMISPASKMSFIYHIGGARIVDGRSKTLKLNEDELNTPGHLM